MPQHGQDLTPGRVVHFVMADETIRPAQVVRVWSSDPLRSPIQYTQGNPEGMYSCCNLVITIDGSNDDKGQWEKDRFLEASRRINTLIKEDKRDEAIRLANAYKSPIFKMSYEINKEPTKDNIYVWQVCHPQGLHAWATSVGYDPYDWRVGSWHWPQDQKMVKPERMMPLNEVVST